MKNCSLFLEQDDITNITKYITDTFPKSKIEITGQSTELFQIKMTKKTGWFGHAFISMIFQTEKNTKDLGFLIKGMTNLISQFAAQSNHTQDALIARVQKTKTIVGIYTEAGYEVFGEEILQIAEAFDGLILIDGLYWLDSNDNLIVDLTGKSSVAQQKTQTGQSSIAQPKLYPSLQLQTSRKGFSF